MWRNFNIYSVDLSGVDKEQDDCCVGGNEESEEIFLIGEPINRHHHQSQNVRDTYTDIITNQKQNIVEIKAYSTSDYEVSAVDGAAQESTSDTDDDVDPTLCFRKILPLLLIIRKASLSFIVFSRTYLSIDEIMIIFSRWPS